MPNPTSVGARTRVGVVASAFALPACGPAVGVPTGTDDASSDGVGSSTVPRHDLGDPADVPTTAADTTTGPPPPPEEVVVFDEECGRAGQPCQFDERYIDVGFFADAILDLDGDGLMDAAAATTTGQWIARAWSPWSFGVVTFSLGSWSGGAVTDVDADGDLDLVRFGESSVSVLRGEGGGFLEPEEWPLGERNNSPTTADLDNDGRAEVVFVDADTDQLGIIRSIPAASAPEVTWYPAGINPLDLAAADLDGDGNVDLAIASPNDDTMVVLRGLGDGTLEAWTTIPTGNSPRSIAIADLDATGSLDLVTADHDDSTLTIALATADDWAPSVIDAPCAEPREIVAAALDDAIVDLVVRPDKGDQLLALRGLGDGTFEAASMLPGNWQTISVVDIEGDGAVEVLASDADPPVIALQGEDLHMVRGYPGIGAGVVEGGDLFVLGISDRVVRSVATGAGPHVIPSAHPVRPHLVADVDDDGVMDVVGIYDGNVALLPGNGVDGFDEPVLLSVPAETIIAARLDDDAWPDYIARDGTQCVAMHGGGAFGFDTLPLDVDCDATRFGDADGDGLTDVLEIVDGVARISRIEGGGLEQWISGDALQMTAALVGDIDGDGAPDVAARHGCCDLVVWSELSDSGMGDPRQLVFPFDRLETIALEDLDADGLDELVTRGNGLWIVAREGDGWVGSKVSTSDCEWTSRHDINEDGVMDLLGVGGDGIAACVSAGR